MSSVVISTPFTFVETYHNTFQQLNKELLDLIDLNRYVNDTHIYELGDLFTTEEGPAFLLVVAIGDTFLVRSPDYLKGKQLEVFKHLMALSIPNDRIVVTTDRDYNAILEVDDMAKIKKFS